jgi:anti-sigma regulatory factor (Ser/Thr protein kinase)
MMESNEMIVARGFSDEFDRLIRAEQALAELQIGCGGELPGTIAVPRLMALVRKSRRLGVALTEVIEAQHEGQLVSVSVEVVPSLTGCDIHLQHWDSVATDEGDRGQDAADRRLALDRHIAILSARLDGDRQVITAHSDHTDFHEVAAAMCGSAGQPWDRFVSIQRKDDLHGALPGAERYRISIENVSGTWEACLFPTAVYGGRASGYELLVFASEAEVAEEASPPGEDDAPPSLEAVFGEGEPIAGQDLDRVLREPVERIIANAARIHGRLAGPISDTYAEHAMEMSGAGQLLLALLRDVSDLDVLEADEFETSQERVDLVDVAFEAASILSAQAREKGIAIDVLGEGAQAWTTADRQRVLQIMINLLSNAVRYSPAETRVAVSFAPEDNGWAAIVDDQGPGIGREDGERVFEKFERLGRNGDGGTGLGLYIARRLARAMKGEVSVEYRDGAGARLVLLLPHALADNA